tara:strand:+ start:291 stop:578 length:288 start_codon:yes stop_codon:yes gene_type:complete
VICGAFTNLEKVQGNKYNVDTNLWENLSAWLGQGIPLALVIFVGGWLIWLARGNRIVKTRDEIPLETFSETQKSDGDFFSQFQETQPSKLFKLIW